MAVLTQEEPQGEDRRKLILLLGWMGTVIWIGFLGYVLLDHYYFNKPPTLMTLNELGDTFAGFFGALAFFWLVLGYFQQGEELRATREEVRLQRLELSRSTEYMSQQTDAISEESAHIKRDVFVQFLRVRFDLLDDIAVEVSLFGALFRNTFNTLINNRGYTRSQSAYYCIIQSMFEQKWIVKFEEMEGFRDRLTMYCEHFQKLLVESIDVTGDKDIAQLLMASDRGRAYARMARYLGQSVLDSSDTEIG